MELVGYEDDETRSPLSFSSWVVHVIYEPCEFTYEYLGKEHIYIPDFMINGKFYEVKGPHLWRGDRLYTPYRNGLTDAECETLDLRDTAKTKCIKENGITMIFSNELDKLNEFFGQVKA